MQRVIFSVYLDWPYLPTWLVTSSLICKGFIPCIDSWAVLEALPVCAEQGLLSFGLFVSWYFPPKEIEESK